MRDIVEEIARQFKIPLDEAKKRMDIFLSGLPKSDLSDEIKKKKVEAMNELVNKRKKSKR